MNVSDNETWTKPKGYRRTGYDSYTDYQSMTGIQNHFEKEVMDIKVTHLQTGVGKSQHT
jgi:hypothetical protein